MSIMRRNVLFLALAGCCLSGSAQTAPGEPGAFRATSTVVTVPTLVRDQSGEPVRNLGVDDFALYDNGLPQSVKLADLGDEPVALVVVVQTGGAGARHFFDYADFPSLLDWLISATYHDRMLVTFDSRVEMIWPFPPRSDGVAHSLTHLHAGDQGAALVDAVQFGVQQLQSEPGQFRRIVLLVSQETDEGSLTPFEESLHTLGKGSTAVYSLTFHAPAPRGKFKPARRAKDRQPITPLAAALNQLHADTASQLAAYTGGAHLSFTTRRDFDEAMKAIATDIRNRYGLSFQPAAHLPGLHQLKVNAREGLRITARGGYWFDPEEKNP